MKNLPYLRDSSDRTRVFLYIDLSDKNKPRYLSDYCWLTQGEKPCKGDPTNPCNQCFAKCNHPEKAVCLDEVGKVLEENNNEFPDHVVKEWVEFAPENWEVKTHIDVNTINVDPNNPERARRDVIKYNTWRLKYFLRDWSLKKYGDEFQIKTRQAQGFSSGIEELMPDILKFIMTNLDPEFVDMIIRAYDRQSDQIYKEISENAVKEVGEATGLSVKN